MALSDQALCTVAELREWITQERTTATSGLLDDTHMEQIIEFASARIAQHCGRQLLVTSADVTYTLDGDGRSLLMLPEWPLVSVTSLTNLYSNEVIPARTTATGDGYSTSDADKLAGLIRLTGYALEVGSAVVSFVGKLGYSATVAATSPATRVSREHATALQQLRNACLAWGALIHTAKVPSAETVSVEGGAAFSIREQAVPTVVRKMLEPFVRIVV